MSVTDSPRSGRRVLAGVAALLTSLATACGEDQAQTCRTSAECGSGVCLDEICQAVTCEGSIDCPSDARCDVDARTCEPDQCRTHGDCASDRTTPFCVDGLCRADPPAECADRTRCGDGEICVEEVCTPVASGAQCAGDEDCGNPEICDLDRGAGRLCVSRCGNNGDCEGLEGSFICNIGTGLCEAVECLQDEDCSDEEVCQDDHTCTVARFECSTLVCDDPAAPFQTEPIGNLCRCVQCLGDNHCDVEAGQTCSRGRRCLFCDTPAESAAECPAEQPYLRDGCCVTCLSADDCTDLGPGAFCDGGRCSTCDCNDDCICPEGTVCDTQDDGSGRCALPRGGLGDDCTSQDGCESFLACSYAEGECVPLGVGGFCGEGCPDPSRCATTAGGGICYGCTHSDHCPPNFICQEPEEWEGVYTGGQCVPGE